MFSKVQDWFEDQDEGFAWWWLLLLPIVVLGVVKIIQRMRSLNEDYPEGYRGMMMGDQEGMVPATGGQTMTMEPTTREMEHEDFRTVGHELTGQDMADFKKPDTQPRTVESRPSSPPMASEDSEAQVSGPRGLKDAEMERDQRSQSGGGTAPTDKTGELESVEMDEGQAGDQGQTDDFRVIEGIGPSISAMLHRSGIRTYKQLAKTNMDRLIGILEEAGIRQITDPTTWPEQSKLADEGKWDELTELQKTLQQGRRKN